MNLEWTRHPEVTLAGSHLVATGDPKPYSVNLPRRGRPVFEDLANVRTDKDASAFTAQWGWLTEDRTHTWASAVRKEAAFLQACVEIWEGSQRQGGLREWNRRSGGVKKLRELSLCADDEWRHRWNEIDERAPERATAIAPAWLWWALRRGLNSLRLVPVKEGPTGSPWRWNPFGRWRWSLEVPDLLTFCYLELAAAMMQGRSPSWCPYCGDVYLVQKERRQETCGKNRCRQAAHRAKDRRKRRKSASRRIRKAISGKTTPRR